MNTEENNKLIANFMGLNLYRSKWYKSTLATEKIICKENELQYHSDWNWLMEVVDKIESLDFNFNITSRDATVLKNHGAIYQTLIYRIDGTKKIKAVYNTCVEFIKWYNQQ
jgi:hypothetical protein